MGSLPSVFHTAPPQPASNARRTWYSEFAGGALASQNGFGAFTPQKSMLRSGMVFILQRGTTETTEISQRREDRFLCGSSVFSVPLWLILNSSISTIHGFRSPPLYRLARRPRFRRHRG